VQDNYLELELSAHPCFREWWQYSQITKMIQWFFRTVRGYASRRRNRKLLENNFLPKLTLPTNLSDLAAPTTTPRFFKLQSRI
jgi:hypothetical protein